MEPLFSLNLLKDRSLSSKVKKGLLSVDETLFCGYCIFLNLCIRSNFHKKKQKKQVQLQN